MGSVQPMPLAIFPIHRLTPQTVKADPAPRVISGGVSISGDEDVIETDGGGRWVITFSGISLNHVWREQMWSAWSSYLRGGARAVLVPVYSLRTAPRPIAGHSPMRPSGIVTDDDVFPTSLSFASPYIVARANSLVPLRGTTIHITVEQGARIEPGMKFGHGLRAYKIERVVSRSGLTAVCIMSPPARAPIPNNALLNFDWPVVQCRAVPGQDLAPEMLWARRGDVSVSFIEDFSDV